MNQRATTVTLLLFGAITIVVAVYTWSVYSDPNRVADGTAETNFTRLAADGEVVFTDTEGNAQALSDYRGNVLVVNAWASWSPFTTSELPLLDALARDYGEQVIFLALNRGESPAQVNAYRATLPELSHITIILDPDDTFYGFSGGFSMPETVIYDRSGDVIEHIRGTLTRERVEGVLAEQLNIPAP